MKFAALAILLGSTLSFAQNTYEYADNFADMAGMEPEFTDYSQLKCVYGPWAFKVGEGYFMGLRSSKICVASNTPVHLSQILTGAVILWNDEGYTWPIATPDRREWWEKARDSSVEVQ